MNLKSHYSHFFNLHENEVHFTAHSHQFWPDVTRNAVLEYWDDSARYVDKKWSYFFSQKLPLLSRYIAKELGDVCPSQLAFAPNTHELVTRLISALPQSRRPVIVSTDSEFHSFYRQALRLKEEGLIELKLVEQFPVDSFKERMIKESEGADFVFFSHVFFNSGLRLTELDSFVDAIANRAPEDALICIDGYHSFMAVDFQLNCLKEKAFYLGGSYKYAQSGEGLCFITVPQGRKFRPLYTGWFADFKGLEGVRDKSITHYSNDGMSFAGSTMDFSTAYKLLAVYKWMESLELKTSNFSSYIEGLSSYFLELANKSKNPVLSHSSFLPGNNSYGRFLAFQHEDGPQLSQKLESANFFTDVRGDVIRFGFAPYHQKSDIDFLFKIIEKL